MDEIQKKIAGKRIGKWCLQNTNIDFIGGFDISYTKDKGITKDVVSFIVINKAMDVVYEKTIVYEDSVDGKREEYKSGYLAFRELPCFRKVWNEMLSDPDFIKPDVTIIDGNGLLHHRKCGSAVHIGVEFGIPTIGVAKKLLFVDGLNRKFIRSEMDRLGS